MSFDTNISENPLKEFATTSDVKSKGEKSFGLRIAKNIDTSFGSGSSYYAARNARYAINRSLTSGKIDIQKRFAGLFDFGGTTNYIALTWQTIKIVNTIVGRLVGRWMQRNEKVHVTAIDAFSKEQKQKKYDNAEFVLDNKELIGQLGQASGVPVVDVNEFIPEDKDDLDMWAAEYNQLPEEIKYSQATNNILSINGWYDVNKERALHDSAQVGFVGTHAEMDNEGIIKVRYVKPENAIYSYSEYPDFRDTTWRGEVVAMKISEIRDKYSEENGGTVSEKEIFDDVVSKAKDFQVPDKLTWRDAWISTPFRPYDDWNVDVLIFYYKTYDTDTYQMKITKSGTLMIDKDPKRIQPNGEGVSRDKWNLYKGCYVRGTDIMLEWEIQNNMIKPQDPKEIGEVEFPYSFYMYQNSDMRNVAVPEKIEDPVDGMILARLKIQQIIAAAIPPGAAINWDSMQEIDYGMGDANKTIDPVKLYKQTGTFYYKGRDAEGKPIGVPINEITNAGFLPQLQGYMQDYQYHYQVLKDELGEDPNLITQASKPRVAVQNIEAAQSEAEAATDYMYLAYTRCMEDTARKIACLLHDSVTEEAKAYRDIVKESDVKGRVFSTKVKLLPDEIELQKLEAMMNNALVTQPDLVLYLDPFKILRIAKDNLELAELLFRRSQKRAIEGRMQQAQQQSQSNGDIQVKSAQATAQMTAQLEKLKGDLDLEKTQMQSEAKNKSVVLTGIMNMYQNGISIPPELHVLVKAVIENVAIPAVAENEHQKQQIMMAMQAAMQQAQPQQQPMDNGQQMPVQAPMQPMEA